MDSFTTITQIIAHKPNVDKRHISLGEFMEPYLYYDDMTNNPKNIIIEWQEGDITFGICFDDVEQPCWYFSDKNVRRVNIDRTGEIPEGILEALRKALG
jgi:hypothetical protein